MTITFKEGLLYKGIKYGWHKRELYRLPGFIGKRLYPLKKLTQVLIANNVGYRIGQRQDRLTLDQLEFLTGPMKFEYNKSTSEDTPFSK